ncbi:MAG: ATP-binding protein [Acidobacteria bacterium]|nr:ATP-binding protein [Acidobacteriota bacterium]
MPGSGVAGLLGWRYLATGFLALSAGCQSLPSEAKQIRIASAALAPLAYADANGQPAGFYVDVMREAARREGLALEYSLRQEGLEAALASGSVDLWAAAVANPGRRRLMYFAEPWWEDDYYLLVNAGSPIKSVADLAGRRVAYGNAPPMAMSIDAAFPGVKGIRLDRPDDRADAVCRGEAEAALLNHPSLFAFFLRRAGACDGIALRLVSQDRLQSELSIAAPFAQQALANRIQTRVREMTQDGTLAKIAEAYPMVSMRNANLIRSSVEEKGRQVGLERALLAALAFGLLSLYWAFKMRRERERSVVARREAERALAIKTEFLATMSHEIRTPLTAVVGYLDMLADTALSPDQKLLAREGRGASAALLGMVSEILDFSHMQAATVNLRLAPCDPCLLFDEVVAAVGPQAEAKGLVMSVRIGPEVPAVVVTDSSRVLQVVMNLAGNAVKFTEQGSVRLGMRYEEGADGQGNLALTVTDTGPGIPLAEQKRIFEPFTQLDSSDRRRHGGVGLGLAIVQRLVSALRGEIQLNSVVGSGTEFAVRIPVERTAERRSWLQVLEAGAAQPMARVFLLGQTELRHRFLLDTLSGLHVPLQVCPDEAALSAELTRVPPGQPVCAIVDVSASPSPLALVQAAPPGIRWVLMGTHQELKQSDSAVLAAFHICGTWPVTVGFLRLLCPSTTSPVRPATMEPLTKPVLVVDDNAVNRKVLGRLLERLGCQVDFATDGEEAVKKFLDGGYGLILMDCQMPVLDGFAATVRIRQVVGRERVRVIGVSASTEELTRRRCLQSGMDGYLAKPIDLARLRAVLEGLPRG